jgi:CRP-like cAMP-binding protein
MGDNDHSFGAIPPRLTVVNYSKTPSPLRPSLAEHPERNVICVQLTQNTVLKQLSKPALAELLSQLVIQDCGKGDCLVRQGDHDMAQCFILDGILKRVVSNADAKEMILRFAAERDVETSYAAWRLRTPVPYSIIAVTKARVAKLPMPQWVAFMDSHAELKAAFEYQVMSLMSEVMAHTITLHLLDAPGRVHRFMRKHAELAERLPKKELAAYLNISPETLSRLKKHGKI